MPQTQPTLYTSPEVAILLKRSARTVHRLVAEGKLVPSHRVNAGRNGTFLFTQEEIDRYLTAETSAA